MADRHGLASVEGGRHPGWGTANRIVPLGNAYLELVTVVDSREAAESAFGRWIAGASPGPLGWAARTDDLDAVAARLELTISEGSRVLPDGGVLAWRLAGVERAGGDPPLPFFIAWDGPLPGTAPVEHPAGAAELLRLDLHGDADRLADWLGHSALPVAVGDGPPCVARIVLRAGARTIVVDAESVGG